MSRPLLDAHRGFLCALAAVGLAYACNHGGGGQSTGNAAGGSGPASAAGEGVVGSAGGTAGAQSAAGAGSARGADGAQSAAGAGSAGGAGLAGAAIGAAGSSAPTFNRVWIEVLEAKGCSSGYCHGGDAGSLLMDNPSHAFANLVRQPAAGPKCGMSSKLRVTPGDASMSLIVDKISNATPSCGDAMPIGVRFDPSCLVPDNPAVCTKQSEIQLVKDWITAGANDD